MLIAIVTLDGIDYFPKEYLDVVEQPQNTNSVEELSDYLRNVVGGNRFEREENEGEGHSPMVQAIHQGSEYGSVSLESQRSYNDNAEEGKSLMEDFNLQHRGQMPLVARHNNSLISNFQGSREALNNFRESPRRELLHMPPIPSEGSKVSQSSESNNFNQLRRDEHNYSVSNFRRSQKDEGESSENDKSQDIRMTRNLQKSSFGRFDISEIKLDSNNVSKKSSPRQLNIQTNNMFRNDANKEIFDAVLPFQEVYGPESAFSDIRYNRQNKIRKPVPQPVSTLFSKSLEEFGKVSSANGVKLKYQRSNTSDIENKEVRFCGVNQS